jgi:hypothetical protein
MKKISPRQEVLECPSCGAQDSLMLTGVEVLCHGFNEGGMKVRIVMAGETEVSPCALPDNQVKIRVKYYCPRCRLPFYMELHQLKDNRGVGVEVGEMEGGRSGMILPKN